MGPDLTRGGAVAGDGSEQKQHVDMFRKVLLRKRLLSSALPGAAYVPFIGDGDISVEVYPDRPVYGADLDPDRVAVAARRIPEPRGDIRCEDCNGWPFPDVGEPFAVADFDAYVDPYTPFYSFWENAEKCDRVVMFFTDGRKQGLGRTGHWTKPDGTKVYLPSLAEHGPGGPRPKVFNSYWIKHIKPWFHEAILPWRVVRDFRYNRSMMVYWGAVIERPEGVQGA